MAWGIWNKIKNGFRKVGKAIGKGLGFVNDKIIKPIVKPIAGVAAPIVDRFVPGAGAFLKPVTDVVSDGIDVVTGKKSAAEAWNDNGDTVKGWVRNRLK